MQVINPTIRFVWTLIIISGLGLLTLSACGNIISIIPSPTPTPVAAATALPSSPAEASPAGSLPVRIVSPPIELDAPVVEMGWSVIEDNGQIITEWDMPNDEAAWHKNSARPGAGNNVVISGHNASTGGHVFAQLDDLQLGDEVTLWTAQEETRTYQIVEKNIIRTFSPSAEAEAYLRTVTQPTGQEQLTLITCWPSWSNTHRLIVIARPKAPLN